MTEGSQSLSQTTPAQDPQKGSLQHSLCKLGNKAQWPCLSPSPLGRF